MSIGNALRLILPLVLAAMSFLASPAHAVTFLQFVNVSHDRKGADNFSNQIAVSGSNVYTVWSEGAGGGSGNQPPLLFSRSTNGGASFGPVTTLFSVFGSSGLAASGSNVYVVRSLSPKPHQPPQVYFRRSTDGGATFASQVQLSSGSGAGFTGISVSGDNVYVLWAATSGLNLSRSNDGGASFYTVNLPNTTGQTGQIRDAKVLADGLNVYVAWTEDGVGIVFTASSDSGANFVTPINIATGYFAALAASGLNVYVAYNLGISGASDGNIFVAHSIDGGLSFLTPTPNVSGAPAGPSHIVADGADVHVVWTGYNPIGPADFFYAHSNTAGASYSLPTNMSNNANTSTTGVVAANGPNVYVSWSDGSDVFLAHSGDSGNTFDPKANVSGNSGTSKYVVTAATPTRIQHCWVDDTPGNADVFCRAGTP